MALPRSKYVKEDQPGVYHCFSRCVRRAFLCGYDTVTKRSFSHRKAWLVDRLRHLAAIFAIEVCAYAVLDNHYHTILRTRPDLVLLWTDREVAIRWLTLFPRKPATTSPTEEQIQALAACPERIAVLRRRLCNLSWFMGRLNEFIARAANKEDDVKGRFWESRFKCQALLDDAAITACMVYVDLNPIRAGLTTTLLTSDFTSIQQRIRAWHKETMTSGLGLPDSGQVTVDGKERIDLPGSIPVDSIDVTVSSDSWLCPIRSDLKRRGILQMTEAEYIDLVDRSGRMLQGGKQGAIDQELAPILLRMGANPEAWVETVSQFGSRFRLAAGVLSHLRIWAHQLGRRWLSGVSMARASFVQSPVRSV